MIIPRKKYLDLLMNKKHNGLIKVITGIRRCGKSFLLTNLFHNYLLSEGVEGNHIIEIALDDRFNKELRNPDKLLFFLKERILDDNMYYIILDEIQMVPEFEDVLNSLLHIKNADVYVTGSNSKFLSSDIITEFRGRGDEIKVYPLTFKEFILAYDNQSNLNKIWDDFYIYGGMPAVLNCKTADEKQKYLSSLFELTYKKDILERYKIKNISELDELLDVLSSSVGSLTHPLNLSKIFKNKLNKNISDVTIQKYISYLIDAFIICKSKRYDVKGKKYIASPCKYYFADTGVRNARLNFRQVEETHLLENVIYNELCARGFSVDIGVVEKMITNKNGVRQRANYEIDFVVNQGSKRFYIQSALSIDNVEKMEQETCSLESVKDSFKKIIIVRNQINIRRNEKGIVTMGLFDFLLNENSLEF